MQEKIKPMMDDASQAFANALSYLDDPQARIWVLSLLGFGIFLIAVAVAVGFAIRRKQRKQLEAIEDSEALAAEVALEEAAEAKVRPQPVPKVLSEVEEVRETDHRTWLEKLRGGLSKTRANFIDNLSSLFAGGARLDEKLLESLHEVLYRADIGVEVADHLVEHVRKTFMKQETAPTWDEVRVALREEAARIASHANRPLNVPAEGPMVILVVGVNGVGKTTSIGKLGAHFLAQDKSVLLCAGDTFRAAAIDQLKVWGERIGANVIAHQQGSDPAAVAYDGVKAAMARKADVLFIDTAGRLHNKNELMDELAKIRRVIGRDLPGAPHETWLVIDATTGQNAVMQVKAFMEVANVTGLIVTKLDGTAKGGVVLGVIEKYKLPVRYIGVGEKAADLREFSPNDFADSLF